jgi:purine nucleoside permease
MISYMHTNLYAEINAASSLSALWTSGCFNLTQTYFMVAGISGGNPHLVTTGSVTFPKYAVQLNLQYEFDRYAVRILRKRCIVFNPSI